MLRPLKKYSLEPAWPQTLRPKACPQSFLEGLMESFSSDPGLIDLVGHMTDYWHTHPPVHVLVAGYMGHWAPRHISDAPELARDLAAMAADLRDDLPEHLRSGLDAFLAAA